jgi:hypothetical protein
MKRWHESHCDRPNVVYKNGIIICKNCRQVLQPDLLKPPDASHHSMPSIPPDKPMGKLNLRWPLGAPYIRSDGETFQPASGHVAAEGSVGTQETPPFEPTIIYERRLLPTEFRLISLDGTPDELDPAPVHVELNMYQQDRSPHYETVSFAVGAFVNSGLCLLTHSVGR